MEDSDTRSYTMAVEAVAEIVSQKLEILLSHPMRLGCLPTETLAMAAKEKLAMIHEFISNQYRPSTSMEWLGQLLQAMYDAEEIIDKFQLREACRRHKALHMATRPLTVLVLNYMLCRGLSNLVKAVKKCQDQCSRKWKPASSSSQASDRWQGIKLARLTAFWDRQASTNFVWREAEKNEIMKRIREGAELGSVHGISILGEQGTGKTFLARWFYREAMYLGCNSRAWVQISASMDKRDFLIEILKQVDKIARDVEGMELNKITAILSKKLAKTKFLIVLDDVHLSNEQLLPTLLTIIQPPAKGCIITMTRDNGIDKTICPYKDPIVLKDLSPEIIQKLLAGKLHKVPNGQNLMDEEMDIIKRCRGLPLCISLLGGLLSNAGKQELTTPSTDGSMMTLSYILEMSYHRLPVHLKPCFIYMALFPVASPIPIKRLVRLWLAEGLLDFHCYNREGEMTRLPEDVGETFILELADRNVIDVVSWRVDGSPKACQMLTSLYDMICLTAMSTGFLHIHAASKSKDKNKHDPTSQQQMMPAQSPGRAKVRWLAEHTNMVKDGSGGSYLAWNLNHVRSFLSFYQRRGMLTKDISKFLRKLTSKTDCSLLRVLDLEGVYKPSLQGVLHKLVLLRYLGLRSTLLDSIPCEVADLHYLETLDIKHTNIALLPSSLWEARNLRHLHLNWFYIDLMKILKACGNDVMALTKLQTLSGLVISEVKENLMTGHMNSLTTLKLFLRHSDNGNSGAAEVAKWISSELINLQSLTFGVIQEAKPEEEAEPAEKPITAAKPAEEAEPKKKAKPATSQIGPLPELLLAEHHNLLELYLLGQLNKPIWPDLLPSSLRVLTLSGSKVERDTMPYLGGLLRNLRTFRLLANSFLCTSLRFMKDGFPGLKILKIWKLPRLEKLIIEQGAMPHLKELEFRHLERLRTVEDIEKCKELENISMISQSDALVDGLKGRIGEKTNLHVEKDTKKPGSTDNDKD